MRSTATKHVEWPQAWLTDLSADLPQQKSFYRVQNQPSTENKSLYTTLVELGNLTWLIALHQQGRFDLGLLVCCMKVWQLSQTNIRPSWMWGKQKTSSQNAQLLLRWSGYLIIQYTPHFLTLDNSQLISWWKVVWGTTTTTTKKVTVGSGFLRHIVFMERANILPRDLIWC